MSSGPPDAPPLVLSASLGIFSPPGSHRRRCSATRSGSSATTGAGTAAPPVRSGPTLARRASRLWPTALELLDPGRARLLACARRAGWAVARRRSAGSNRPARARQHHGGPREQWLERAQRVRAEGVAAIADAVARAAGSRAPRLRKLVDRFREQPLAAHRPRVRGCCEALADAGTLTGRAPRLAAADAPRDGSDDPVCWRATPTALAAAIPNARHHSPSPRAAHIANARAARRVHPELLDHLTEEGR